ncbi:LytR/AlgR family response regulator transcription factor [Thomasclavelia cocleata]|uniref:LytR/AlgR family response regulator transcription factor n=1 Tax=Thomasclavelia cocleata TaxID=69824 RepID=UPI00257700A5|nr:LytTR family DNA-binding domain-containing protein [Thomasclavelia cocleata]
MIAIIDDDYNFAEILKKELEKYYTEKEIKILTNFDTVFLANNSIKTLFLDIELGSENGIDLAVEYYRYNQRGNAPDIIFVSSHENYVHYSFVAMPLYFIRKEKLVTDLKECMNIINYKNRRKNAKIEVNDDTIKVSQIIFVESKSNYVYYTLDNGRKIKHRTKISLVEETLKEYDFIRCHVSYVINAACITDISKDYVILNDNVKISVSPARYRDVLEAYKQYRWRKS